MVDREKQNKWWMERGVGHMKGERIKRIFNVSLYVQLALTPIVTKETEMCPMAVSRSLVSCLTHSPILSLKTPSYSFLNQYRQINVVL